MQPVAAAPAAVDRALMTIPATAAYLGKPVATLYEWARRGELPATVRINGRYYVKRLELDRWLAGEALPA